MSKSIRSFFVSTTTDTNVEAPERGSKRIKTEQLLTVAATVSEASEVDATPASTAVLEPLAETPVAEVAPDELKFGWLPFDSMEPGWKLSLAPEFKRPYFQNLLAFLNAESKSQTIFPPTMEIFTALNLCPLDKVKVTLYLHVM